MGCLFAAVIVLGISLALVMIFASTVHSRATRWNEAFAHVARQFHGAYTGGGWFSEPSVRLMYGTAHARLSCYSLGARGSAWSSSSSSSARSAAGARYCRGHRR